MPIYMDRHDVSENITAEDIAQLHQKDIAIEKQFGCRGLTYWFDDKRKTAFCLIEAPDAKAIQKMHSKAHGDVPHSVIEVEPGIVESFLGRIEDPKKARNTELNIINDPAFRTIMVITIDRVLLKKKDEASFEAALKDFNKAVRKILRAHNGQPVTQTDFHWLVSFKSVTHATHAAFEIRLLKKAGDRQPGLKQIGLKIGLSAGVPVTQKQLIFEDAVKLAERMCGVVEGEIIVSAEVMDLYKSENAQSVDKGKGISYLTPADEKFITQLMDYTEENWSDGNLKADDFCKPVGCSKSQLYRKMIALTGKSPNTFIRDYRLNEALKLLKKNAGNISEIAFQTGFSSPSYFSKCFLKRYGHIPSEYLSLSEVQ